MTDFAALWLRSQITTGETVIALRQAGYDWRAITDRLHLGSIDDARRAAALFLSADLESREAHRDGAGEAQGAPTADWITRGRARDCDGAVKLTAYGRGCGSMHPPGPRVATGGRTCSCSAAPHQRYAIHNAEDCPSVAIYDE